MMVKKGMGFETALLNFFADGVPVEQIGQIADFMYEWEGSVAEQLGLSRPEVAAIKKRYPEDLNLQTYGKVHA